MREHEYVTLAKTTIYESTAAKKIEEGSKRASTYISTKVKEANLKVDEKHPKLAKARDMSLNGGVILRKFYFGSLDFILKKVGLIPHCPAGCMSREKIEELAALDAQVMLLPVEAEEEKQ